MKSFGKSLVTAIQKIDSICSQGNLRNPTKKIHVVSRNTSLSNAVQLRKKRYLQKTKNLRTIHKVLSENLENYQRNSSWENLRTYLTVSKEIDNLDSVDYLDKPQVSNSCINTETGKLNKKEFNVEKYTKSPYSTISLAKVMSSNETRKEPNSSQIPFTVLSKVKIVDSHNISGDIKKRVKYRGQNLDENNIHLNNSKTEFKNSSKSSIRSTRSGLKPVKDVGENLKYAKISNYKINKTGSNKYQFLRSKYDVKENYKPSINFKIDGTSKTSIKPEFLLIKKGLEQDTRKNLKYVRLSNLESNKYQNLTSSKDCIKKFSKSSTNLDINKISSTHIKHKLPSKRKGINLVPIEHLQRTKTSKLIQNKTESNKYENFSHSNIARIYEPPINLKKNKTSTTSIRPETPIKKELNTGNFKHSKISNFETNKMDLNKYYNSVRGKDHIKQIFKSSTNLDVNKHSITSITRESGKDTGENLKYAKPSDLKINKMRSKKYQNFVHLKDGIKNDLKASTNLGINRTSIRPDLESKNEELESKKGTREMLDCDKISNFKVNKIESKYKNTIYPKDDYEKIIKSTVDLEKNTKSNTSISPEYLAKKGLEPGKYTRENLKYTNFGISETTTNKDKYFARSKDDNKKIHKSSTNVEINRNLSIFIKSERRSKKEELKPEKDTRENIKYTKLTSFDINRTQTNPYKNSTYSKNDNKQIHKSTTNVEMNRITRIPVKLEFHSKKEEFETEKENLKYTGLSNFKMNKMETNKYNNSAYSKYDNKKIHKSSTNLDMNRVNSISVRPELGTNKELELGKDTIDYLKYARISNFEINNIQTNKYNKSTESKDDNKILKSTGNLEMNRISSISSRPELRLKKEDLEPEKDGKLSNFRNYNMKAKKYNNSVSSEDYKSSTDLDTTRNSSTSIKPEVRINKKELKLANNSENLRQTKVSKNKINKLGSNEYQTFVYSKRDNKKLYKSTTNLELNRNSSISIRPGVFSRKKELKLAKNSENIRHFKESGKNFANSKDDKFFYKSITNIDINRNSSPSIRKELSLIKEELESEKDIGENYKYAKTSNIKKRSNKCHTKDDIKNFFMSCTNLETYIKPKLYSTKKKLVEDNSEELRQAKVSNFDKNKTESNNINDFTLKNIHKPSTNVKIANSTNYINQNTERQLKDEQKIVPQSEKIYLESNFPKTGCRLAYEMAIAEVNNNIEQDLSSNNLTWTKQKIIAKMQNLNKESHYENVARKWNNPQNLQQNLPLNPKLQSTPKLINIKKNKSVKESSNLQSPVVINNFLTLFNKVKHSKSNMKYQVVLSCAQPTVKINEPLISDNKEAAQSKRTTILELMLKHKKEKDCFTPGYSLKYKLSSKFHNNQTNGQFFKRDSTERLKENPMIGSKTRNEGFNFYRPIKSSSVLEHILSKKDPRVYSSASDC